MEFKYEYEDTVISVKIPNDSTLDETLEAIQCFLRAAGFTISYDETLTVAPIDA